MGFYATDTLEAAPPRSASARRACGGEAPERRRARRDPACSRKPLRGPTRGAISGLRYYSPGVGRWPSRERIGERGGPNLQSFCLNSPLGLVDINGLWSWPAGLPWDWGIPGSDPTQEWRLVRSKKRYQSFFIDTGDTPVEDGDACSELGAERRWLVPGEDNVKDYLVQTTQNETIKGRAKHIRKRNVFAQRFDVFNAVCTCAPEYAASPSMFSWRVSQGGEEWEIKAIETVEEYWWLWFLTLPRRDKDERST